MLNQWFYSHSTWAVAFLVCTVLTSVPLVSLFFTHRLIDWSSREGSTKMVGLSYVLCGSIYAVVLAFVAVVTYQTMEKSTMIATEEANSLSSLAFDSAGLPPEFGHGLREDVNRYIDIVVNKEWPRQKAYDMADVNFAEGNGLVRKLCLELATFEPANQGQFAVKAEMLRVVNDLASERRTRLLAANAHLPDEIWQMLIAGLVLVAFYLALFGPFSFKMHLAVTALTMISIGLVFTLVIALDYPFRGELSVDDEAYKAVKEVAERAFASSPHHAEPAHR